MLFFLLSFNVLCGGAALIGEAMLAVSEAKSVYVFSEILNSSSYIGAFTVPVWFFLAISKNKSVEPFGLQLALSSTRPTFTASALMFLGTGMCFAASYVNSVLFPVSEEAADIFFAGEIRGGYAVVLMFISTAIVPAFVEELLFRGVVLSSIKPYSESGAVLISALLFGLMHQTPFQVFYATAIGVILGILRIKTESIWTGVLVHFFNNFLSVLQSYLLECYDGRTGEVLYTTITLAVAAIGILLGAALYSLTRKRVAVKEAAQLGVFQSHDTSCEMDLKPENRMVYKAFWSPTMIIFIVLCGVTMLTTAIAMNGV